MKNLLFLLIFSVLACSCDTERQIEDQNPITSYVGNWSGKLHSDKFCSGNNGTWYFSISADGKIKDAKFIISDVEYTINEPTIEYRSTFSSMKGSYILSNKVYKINGTLQNNGELAGTWESTTQDNKCWIGNKK